MPTDVRHDHARTSQEIYSGRTTDVLRTTDKSQRTDDRHRPDDRCHDDKTILAEVRRPPDVRTPVSDRKSNPDRTPDTACAQPGLWPCISLPLTPSWLRLYIDHPHLLSRVSKGLAHFCVRALLIHLVTFSSELTTSSDKIPQADSKTSARRRPPQDLLLGEGSPL